MKKLIVAFCLLALCTSSFAQKYEESCPQYQPKISLRPSMTVLLYPKGQAAGEGIVENGVKITNGPKEDNGLRGEETNTDSGSRRNVGDEARMDFYFPKKGNGQMVIMTPGGGYEHLSTFNEGVYGSEWFTKHGVAVCVLKYRMPNGHETVPLDDVQNAFRYCRHHAREWGIKQIGVTGGSAGGHLSAIASVLYTDKITRPDFAVLLYPRITLTEKVKCSTRDHLLGKKDLWKDNMDVYREKLAYWSPHNHVTKNTPPTFFVLSADDNSVDARDFLPYYEQLIENEVLVEVHVFPSGSHGWGYSSEKIKGKGKDKFARYRPEFEDCLERWLEDRRAEIK